MTKNRFAATGAIAEIGVCSNRPGEYSLNTLNGKLLDGNCASSWEGKKFSNEIVAVRAYASRFFNRGKIRKNWDGRFLVFPA